MNPSDRLVAIWARLNAEDSWAETWKQVPGLDGYEVSDYGNFRPYYKKGNHKSKRTDFPRSLSQFTSSTGYRTVNLAIPESNPRVHSTRHIHRMVMLAFVGPCPEGKEVAHLNGNPSDNRLSNLAYVTHRENESHKIAHGTVPRGERNGAVVLQGWQVAEIRYLASMSVPQGKIAALFDMDHKRVSEVLAGGWVEWPARTPNESEIG
jgi:hypothetical protein